MWPVGVTAIPGTEVVVQPLSLGRAVSRAEVAVFVVGGSGRALRTWAFPGHSHALAQRAASPLVLALWAPAHPPQHRPVSTVDSITPSEWSFSKATCPSCQL